MNDVRWRYTRHGLRAHAVRVGEAMALCGRQPRWFSRWYGEVDEAEQARAANLPRCLACEHRESREEWISHACGQRRR